MSRVVCQFSCGAASAVATKLPFSAETNETACQIFLSKKVGAPVLRAEIELIQCSPISA